MSEQKSIYRSVRYATAPDSMLGASNEQLRSRYLVSGLFAPDEVSLSYSHFERMVIGGAAPVHEKLALPAGAVDSTMPRTSISVQTRCENVRRNEWPSTARVEQGSRIERKIFPASVVDGGRRAAEGKILPGDPD